MLRSAHGVNGTQKRNHKRYEYKFLTRDNSLKQIEAQDHASVVAKQVVFYFRDTSTLP